MLKFYVKVFYVMGKALSGKLSCPCDRSCLTYNFRKAAAGEHWHPHEVLLYYHILFTSGYF